MADLVATMRVISETTHRHDGHAMRSVHVKSHGILKCEAEVLDGLPDVFRRDIFARPARFPVVMRFSTPPGDMIRDRMSPFIQRPFSACLHLPLLSRPTEHRNDLPEAPPRRRRSGHHFLRFTHGHRAADPPKDGKHHSKATVAAQKATVKVRADADMEAVLTELAALNGKAIEKITVAEARQQPTPTDAVMALLKKQGKSTDPLQLVPGITTADKSIPGPGGALESTVYTPAGAGPFPVVVYFHGGGWVIADRKVYDGGARGLAKASNAVVVSVDYRRAPEAKFPAQWDDALAAYTWVAANAASLKGDPAKLALAGESAGGNLAVATAVAALKSGTTQPKAVIAVYPVAQNSINTPSYLTNAIAAPLNRAMVPIWKTR